MDVVSGLTGEVSQVTAGVGVDTRVTPAFLMLQLVLLNGLFVCGIRIVNMTHRWVDMRVSVPYGTYPSPEEFEQVPMKWTKCDYPVFPNALLGRASQGPRLLRREAVFQIN